MDEPDPSTYWLWLRSEKPAMLRTSVTPTESCSLLPVSTKLATVPTFRTGALPPPLWPKSEPETCRLLPVTKSYNPASLLCTDRLDKLRLPDTARIATALCLPLTAPDMSRFC